MLLTFAFPVFYLLVRLKGFINTHDNDLNHFRINCKHLELVMLVLPG